MACDGPPFPGTGCPVLGFGYILLSMNWLMYGVCICPPPPPHFLIWLVKMSEWKHLWNIFSSEVVYVDLVFIYNAWSHWLHLNSPIHQCPPKWTGISSCVYSCCYLNVSCVSYNPLQIFRFNRNFWNSILCVILHLIYLKRNGPGHR